MKNISEHVIFTAFDSRNNDAGKIINKYISHENVELSVSKMYS